MKIGDLVVYKDPHWKHLAGVIIKEILGTEERRYVRWVNGTYGCFPERNLEPYGDN